ncbi:MAG: RnfABCDGE type electron transport complex subunit D [Atopobiaceae bacterium]|jgi:electron transport complex protein RnfD
MAEDKGEKNQAAAPGNNFESALSLSVAPQIVGTTTTRSIMRTMLVALTPAAIAAVVIFGLRAALLIAVSVASSVAFEYLWCRLRKTPQTVGDLSAAVTGVLVAFNVPASLPLYMVVVGCFIAIVLVKELFGGIGKNFANPAIVARIILSISWPAAMTSYPVPQVMLSSYDAVSSATMLAQTAEKLPWLDMFLGTEMGVLGETSALAILLGFAYLLAKKTISWHVPVIYTGLVFVFSALMGLDPVAQILSGGVLLGAVFMATDYTTAPLTVRGKVVFACGLALITCLIRFWGNMNEGCAYSILFMSLLVPFIDDATRARPLGAPKKSFARAKRRGDGGE